MSVKCFGELFLAEVPESNIWMNIIIIIVIYIAFTNS